MSKKSLIRELVKSSKTKNPMQYVRNIVKELDKDNLNDQILNCKDCDSYCSNKSRCFGNPNASLMIIGDSYDVEDMNDGTTKPFNKEEFKYVEIALDYYNMNYDEVFFMNSVNCVNVRKNGNEIIQMPANPEQVTNCKKYVLYAIEFVQPDAIMLLGDLSPRMLIKNYDVSKKGSWFSIKGIPTITTHAPSFLLEIRGNMSQELVSEKNFEFLDAFKKVSDYISKKRPGGVGS